jgi:hypothetical protein
MMVKERGAIKDYPINLAYILAEVAVINTHYPVYCLVLDDVTIRQIDRRILLETWADRGLAPFSILSRTDLLRKLA